MGFRCRDIAGLDGRLRLRQHLAQLQHGHLASSLNSLTKRQIFFNLAQAATDPEFVPSQATISIGTAQTLNSVTPSVSVPVGLPVVTTSRLGAGSGFASGSFFSTQVTSPTPTLGVQFVD